MSRDTQFQGFAKLVLLELAQHGYINYLDCMNEEMVSIVARRAYDFACHVWEESTGGGNAEFAIECVRDMVELPKEQGHE